MQTFLPYSDFSLSAASLDYRRLGKQRVEVLQILRALHGETTGWRTHPATKMWRGYERSLAWYGLVMCGEWKSRGYRDTCTSKIGKYMSFGKIIKPHWLGGEIHYTHKINLIYKDRDFYSNIWPSLYDAKYVEYFWPKGLTPTDTRV